MPKGYSKYNQGGWNHTKKTKLVLSSKKIGLQANEKNPRWMGDKVSYSALHNWVRSHFKKPLVCDSCDKNPGKNKLGRNKLQWANRSNEYKRERSDWICLCGKCHNKFDRPWLKRKKRNNTTSKHKNICFDKSRNKWLAQLNVNKKNVFRKRFDTEKEALYNIKKIRKKYYDE